MDRMSILILAGTPEAIRIAQLLHPHVPVIMSYAAEPRTRPNALRGVFYHIGRFTSSHDLNTFAARHHVRLIVDATHPFAQQISMTVHCAHVPALHVQRPPWPAQKEWQYVASFDKVHTTLPPKARIFWSIGRQGFKQATPFINTHTTQWHIVRVLEAPAPPAAHLCLFGRPAGFEHEVNLMRTHSITHLVTKDSGGATGTAKLRAAQYLDIQVVVVNRPLYPASMHIHTLAQAIAILRTTIKDYL